MTPKHTNPTQLRYDEKNNVYVQARAPYNFVPLPEKMVPARTPPDHDRYDPELMTGWIDVTVETYSPTYIRGMMTEVDWKKYNETAFVGLNKDDAQKLKEERDKAQAHFFSTSEDREGEYFKPVIPGSSLRGMIRALVEVVGYGRVRWVGNKPTVTFRAVAAESNDPLRNQYRDLLGSNSKNVRAGYLVKEGDKLYVQPAQTLKEVGYKTNDRYFLKVDDEDLNDRDLPGFIKMFDNDYRPQIHEVSFESGPRKPKRTNRAKTRPSVIVKPRAAKLGYDGVLVCSGNMVETSEEKQESARSKHYIILSPRKGPRLPIYPEVIEDYQNSLTPFQKENLTDWSGKDCPDWGCLGNGKPVFYVTDNSDRPTKVIFFGHSPNFRIPALVNGHTATPSDFLPESLRNDPRPDLADAIFGWVEEKDWGPHDENRKQYAGRVSCSDANFVGAEDGIWYSDDPITPKTLASPKPTTFQHYLVQDGEQGHHPDRKSQIAHFGTSPTQTTIRGHKFYWAKGKDPDIKAGKKDLQHETQLTRMVPVKAGVRFSFKLHFENLQPEELGVLWWALTLGGHTETHHHRIGMGKPLGMGAITLKPELHLSRRKGEQDQTGRYDQLFAGNGWHEPAMHPANGGEFMAIFEKYVLKENKVDETKNRLDEVDRIQALLEILRSRGDQPEKEWLELTRYMEIEHQEGGKEYNEYKERPVLPSPSAIQTWLNRPAKEVERPNSHRNKKTRN